MKSFYYFFIIFLLFLGLKKNNKDLLIVGVSPDYPPFIFIENKELKGFDFDLINIIAKRLNKQLEIRSMDFDLLLPELQLGNIQIIIGGMTATAERSEQVFFTDSYISDLEIVALARKNSKINNIENLRDKRIVVNEGYVADDFITNSKIVPIRVSSLPDALFLLTIGQADVFVSSKVSLIPYLKQLGDNFSIFDFNAIKESYSIGFGKKYLNLANQVQKELSKMKDDDTIFRLKEKWGIS